MHIDKIEFRQVNKGKLLAFATVYFDNGLMVDNFTIMEGTRGLFAGWPSVKSGKNENGKDTYKYIVSTSDKEMFKEIGNKLIAEYKEFKTANNPVKRSSGPVKQTEDDDLPF